MSTEQVPEPELVMAEIVGRVINLAVAEVEQRLRDEGFEPTEFVEPMFRLQFKTRQTAFAAYRRLEGDEWIVRRVGPLTLEVPIFIDGLPSDG